MLVVDRVAALHRAPLFARVPGRALAAVALAAEEVELPAGTELITEGAMEDTFYVLVAGRVQVRRAGRPLAELGPGSTVGELAVLVPEPRAASVTATEATVALRLRKVDLDALLAEHPELARSVIESLVATIRRPVDPHPTG